MSKGVTSRQRRLLNDDKRLLQGNFKKKFMKKFRNDIVTLRAIAVIAVVFYHFKIPFFSGGYAGVDIFFVLSGYLMSSIYYDRISTGTRGVLDFYISRVKRLFPALLATCVATTILIYAILPEYMALNFIKEAKHALTFTSNSFYNIRSSYFSEASETYWLLHTWSLSVEFQFYLIFPFIVLLSKKIPSKNKAIATYIVLMIISFAYCLYLAGHKGESPFYLLSTRAWELLAGAAASRVVLTASNRLRFVLSSVGAIMVVGSILLLKEPTSWPDMKTLLPVFGAVICIIACNNSHFDFKSNRVVRFIADISYSWYLSHWIVVSYINNSDLQLEGKTIIIGIAASFAAAVVSWLFIERSLGASLKRVVSFAVVTAAVMVPLGHTISTSVGAISQYTDYASSDDVKTQFHFECFVQGPKFNVADFRASGCESIDPKKKTVLLIGDSHAAQLSTSFRKNISGYNIIQFTASGCFPFKDAYKDVDNGCSQLMAYLFNDFLPKHHVDYAVVSAHLIVYAGDHIEERVGTLSGDLKKYVPNVYAVGQTKVFLKPFVKVALTNRKEDICIHQRDDVKGFNDWLHKMYANGGVSYIDVFALDEIDNICGLSKDGEPLYFDTNHLTPTGADIITKTIKKSVAL
ncbi:MULTISPECIES: acyltransferase family protein [Pseudescherichia]|uniref:acyltransferase family protein n=1 Tax=Pseudescherichia TaxID=2055880 RepID=UPI00301E1D4C